MKTTIALAMVLVVGFYVTTSMANTSESPKGTSVSSPLPQLQPKSPQPEQFMPSPAQTKDAPERDHESLDKVVNLLSSAAQILEVAVGVLALALALAVSMGFAEVRRWHSIRREMEESAESLKRMRSTLSDTRARLSQQLKHARAELDITPTQDQIDTADELALTLRILPLIGEPLTAEDYVFLGIDCFYKKRHTKALEYFEEALKRDTSMDSAWNYKSLIFCTMGKYDEMLKAAEAALERNPNNASAWNNKGAALIKINRLDDAFDSLRRAKALRSGFDEVWLNESVVHLKRGDKVQALRSLAEAIRLDSANRAWARKDPDFEALHSDPGFRELTSEP